ncbi:MAG: PTS sugar transporter subunit IIA [Thomasclavelia sp.]|nr:PTS sugar transporter subunit IIA [Thomasclavelia sp.]
MLKDEYIYQDVDVSSKNELLKFISKKALEMKLTNDSEALYNDFLEREGKFSTGLQDGFAIPHARTDNVNEVAIMYIRSKNYIEWGTLDDKPVKYFFVLLVPAKSEGNVHLQMISKLAVCLLDDDFKEKVKSSNDKVWLRNYILKKMKEE